MSRPNPPSGKDQREDTPGDKRTRQEIHVDVEFSNRYRLEGIKHTMSLAAGVFVFTVAFVKNIAGSDPVHKWLLLVGWLAMALSLAAGLIQLFRWEKFFITFRDYAYKKEEGIKVRRIINILGRADRCVQYISFIGGVVFIGIFLSRNLK